MAIKLVRSVLPPAVINGSGSPVIGIIPSVMPTLMIRGKKKMLTAPAAKSRPYISFASMAIRSPRQITTA